MYNVSLLFRDHFLRKKCQILSIFFNHRADDDDSDDDDDDDDDDDKKVAEIFCSHTYPSNCKTSNKIVFQR